MSHSFDISKIQTLLERYSGKTRTDLLPLLHEVQSVYGWIPAEVQRAVSHTLRVPEADIHGVIEFYSMFYSRPTAKRVIRVCEDSACTLAGGKAAMAAVENAFELKNGETADDGSVTYEKVPCLGLCEHAPAALDGDTPVYALATVSSPSDTLTNGATPKMKARVYGDPALLTARINEVRPGRLFDYRDEGGYNALEKALAMTPDALIDEVERMGILGRGGAMFPLGRKWRFTRAAAGGAAQKHIVANADESEPGTFKDRILMENDPFSLIEAMTIAAYAVGAENGWIFIRGEYPRAYKILKNAVQSARNAKLLGRNIYGKPGFDFDIKIRRGAGAYICGEETALFEAIEGKRGFPRIKPPYPVNDGLFGQPTAINNVETLCAMRAALDIGVDQWLALGTQKSPGTKLFCLSGHVANPGTYEIPFGMTVAQLIEKAGGVSGNGELQAVLMGGAAGVFVKPSQLDMPLTYEAARSANVPLGSGVVMLFDSSVDLRHILIDLGRFFAHESCGKCFPCQLGTQRQLELLEGNGDRQSLLDLGLTMSQTSLCGLGQTAASAVISAITLWPELTE